MTKSKSIVKQKFDAQIPDLFFHYTTSLGLVGILESGKIWTSKILYMNDTSEVQLAIDCINNEINLQRKGIGNTRTEKELDIMSSAIEHIETVNVSVTSFTELGDQLSQWRGYSDIGNGYSLGFDAAKLRERVHDINGYYLLPCIYEEEEQKQLAKEIVDCYPNKDLLESARKKHKLMDDEYHFLTAFSDAVLSFAPLIKSKTFQEEKEWRLISPPLSYSEAKFRQGKHSLIPYWEFDLDLENTLKEIIIGPTPEPKLSSLAVRGLLIKKNFIRYSKDVSISQSEIPFRKV
jgi:hypothetical protein